jgi:hypothetical protein
MNKPRDQHHGPHREEAREDTALNSGRLLERARERTRRESVGAAVKAGSGPVASILITYGVAVSEARPYP